jgi:Invasion associated locus B (IalB) protein
MMRFWLRCLSTLLILTIAAMSPVRAAEKEVKHTTTKHFVASPNVQRLGGAGSWSAYLYKERAGRVCYMAGGPQKSEPAKFKRKPPAAMITHRPEESIANVVSFDEGYPLKEGSDVSLDVSGAHFDLFTKGDTAWSRTADLDKTIVEAMAKGKQAVVKATRQQGPTTTDTYSLSGFAPTLALIDKACSVKR